MAKKSFDFEMYRYTPSLVGPIICIIAFSILASLHLWQWIRCKKLMILWLVVGALCEVGGYGARIGSHYNNKAWAEFIIQGVLLLVGPLFFAATIYMMLGRNIRMSNGTDVSIIHPKWCTRIFVAADVGTLIIQGLGGSIMGTMKLKLVLAGQNIVIAGLSLQVATFVVFLVIAIDFHRRMNKKALNTDPSNTSNDWRKALWVIYGVSSLILLRCVFRLIEYASGNASYLMAHEWCLWVFDTVPMFLVLISMLVLQPTKYEHEESRKLGDSDMSTNELSMAHA